MDKDIARLNVEHFRKKLGEMNDTKQRETLLRLLVEEEAKLAAVIEPDERRKKRR